MNNLRPNAFIDKNGVIKSVNDDYCELLGFTPEEMIGTHISQIRTPNFPDAFTEEISRILQKGKGYNGFTQEIAKDGTIKYLVMSLTPVFSNGSYQGYNALKKLADEQAVTEAFTKADSGKYDYINGRFVPRWYNRSIGKLFNLNTLTLVAGITTLSSALIIGSAYVYKGIKSVEVEHHATESFAKHLNTEVAGMIEEKKGIGMTNVVGLTNSRFVRDSVRLNEPESLDEEFNQLRKHYADNSKLKNIKVEFYNLDGISIYRSHGENRIDPIDKSEQSHIRVALSKKESGFYSVFSENGLQLRSVSPVKVNGEVVGLVEMSQGVRSVKKELEKMHGHFYAVAVNKEYVKNHASASVQEANASNPEFGSDGKYMTCGPNSSKCVITQEHLELIKGVNMEELIERGALKHGTFFHVATPVMDAESKQIGAHILSLPSAEYDNYLEQQLDVVNQSFFAVATATLITAITLLFFVWLLIVRRVKSMEEEIASSVDSGDLFKRVTVYGQNEIANLGKAYNVQISRVQQSNQDVLKVLSNLAVGNLDTKIETDYRADFEVMKNKVNSTVDGLNETFASIEEVLSDLKNGEFDNEHENHLSGQYYEIVESAKNTMHDLSTVFKEISSVMSQASRGDFERTVNASSKGEIQELVTMVNQSMTNISSAFNDIVNAANRLADGDFTQTIDSDYEYKMDEAKQSINKAVNDLRNIVRNVHEVSQVVRTNASSVAEGTESLNSRTQEQAASLEETSAAMEETSSQVEQNLELTSSAHSASKVQSERLEEANSTMVETQTSMTEIKAVSEEIKTITDSIDGIAFQTNLLALNAAVEAARAGEHGRGFAVVAGEVRALAQKSADAAKDIKDLIDKTSEAIDTGVIQVDKVGNSLKIVSEETQKVAQMIGAIQTSSNEQATGINQVNNSITSIDSVTQQNAALVEQTYATCEELVGSADNLSESVSKLKI